jgi:hypothetical protein
VRWFEARLGDVVRVRFACAEHGEPTLFTSDNLGDDVMTAAAAGSGAAMIADLGHAASTGGANGTTDIAIGQGVAVTDEHRAVLKLSHLIMKINCKFSELARIQKCPITSATCKDKTQPTQDVEASARASAAYAAGRTE